MLRDPRPTIEELKMISCFMAAIESNFCPNCSNTNNMAECCMDIEKNDTSIVAAMLLQDDLHNYSKIANLASMLEGGDPNMASAL
jgi:hypothetical protein